ncbi:MAG: hypothetical protein ABL986_19925 [Vicinamibacterales bacterium]
MAPDALHRGVNVEPWKATTRVAFRFVFVYILVYAAATQILGGLLLFPGLSFPALGTRWPMRDITTWFATRALRLDSPLIVTGNSGDTAFYWAQTFWLLLLAALIAAVWSELDRRRAYPTLHGWFRVFVRWAVAAQLFYYGMAKVIPTQFPAPSLVTLVEHVGNLSLDDLLWTFIGASTPYQIFTGVAEVAAGALLVIPQTATLGAILALFDMVQVFLLNMTYDFGLKQISAHLILMCVILLAPEASALWRVVVLNRGGGPRPDLEPPATRSRRATVAQLVFGVYLLAMFTSLSWNNWFAISGGRPRSPAYGIWNVERLSIGGDTQLPAPNAYDYRWRRVIFDTPDVVVIQRTDDSFLHYVSAFDDSGQRVTLRKGGSTRFQGEWTLQRVSDDGLTLSGVMEGHEVEATLTRVGLDTFKLRNSGFRWIRP